MFRAWSSGLRVQGNARGLGFVELIVHSDPFGPQAYPTHVPGPFGVP